MMLWIKLVSVPPVPHPLVTLEGVKPPSVWVSTVNVVNLLWLCLVLEVGRREN